MYHLELETLGQHEAQDQSTVVESSGRTNGYRMKYQDEIDSDVRRLIETDFGKLSDSIDPVHILLDWIQYRARLIPRRPRTVIYSSVALEARVDHPCMDQVARALRDGWDMAGWLSNRIHNNKMNPKADLLFNHWQISHFHFGVLKNDNAVWRHKRRDALIYAYISADHAIILCVGTHGDWANPELVRILRDTYPPAVREIRGIFGRETQPSNVEQQEYILTCRRNGVSPPVILDGGIFLGGPGITSSGHALRLKYRYTRFCGAVSSLRACLDRGFLRSDLKLALHTPLGVPPRIGVRYELDGHLVIYDKARAIDLHREGPLE